MQNFMSRKGFLLGIIILLFIGNFASVFSLEINNKNNKSSSKGVLYVGGSGFGNFSKIQDAIDNASYGDTVYVYDESSPYFEYLKINKKINLIGEDRDTTILDGNGNGTLVEIISDDVFISGFTFKNSLNEPTDEYFGIQVSSNYNIISNNHFGPNNMGGITIEIPGRKNIISDNTFYNNYGGIRLNGSERNTIKNNIIYSNFLIGITILGYGHDNLVLNNTLYYNDFFGGIFLGDFSYNNTIKGNDISNHSYGILIGYVSNNNIILENIISFNEIGIFIGFFSYSCYDNIIYHNNFLDNTENANDLDDNMWDNGKEGNYWSDYRDKYPFARKKILTPWIWNTPYEIPNMGKDRYPLVNEWPKTLSKTMPINKLYDSNFYLLEWFFERFPNTFPILRQIFVL